MKKDFYVMIAKMLLAIAIYGFLCDVIATIYKDDVFKIDMNVVRLDEYEK